jgi:phage terminase small subunit
MRATYWEKEMLNPRQQRFVSEYALDQNATQSAIRAGYSKKTAREMGCENLTKPVIAAAIKSNLARLSAKTENTYAGLVEEAMELRRLAKAEGDYRTALSANAELAKLGGHYPSEKLQVDADVKVKDIGVTAMRALIDSVIAGRPAK